MSDQDTVQASDQVKPFIEKMEQKELPTPYGRIYHLAR